MPLRRLALVLTLVVAALSGAAAPAHASADLVRAPRACDGCPAPVPCRGGCWTPAADLRWQIQLQWVKGFCPTGGINTAVTAPPFTGGTPVTPTVIAMDMYADSDHCSYGPSTANKPAVDAVHTAGGFAIAYVDAGTWERWRPDAGAFVAFDHRCGGCLLGKTLGGFPDERYVNIHDPAERRFLLQRMRLRMKKAAGAGFDGVYFDNQDEYHWAATGFPITRHDQLMYLTRLANIAHRLGLAAGPNNDILQTGKFQPYVDLQVNESCFRYSECGYMRPMLTAGKPILEIEYGAAPSTFCRKANALGIDSIRKSPDLYDLPWVPCR